MPPAAAAGAAQGGAQQGGQQQNGVGNFLSGLIRMGMMWYMFNMFKGGGQQPATGPAAAQLKPLYARGEPVDMRVFLYERPYLHDYSKGVLVWQETDIPLGTAKERRLNYTYHPSESVKNNGSLYAHAVFSRAGVDLAAQDLPPGSVWTKTLPLIRYMAPLKNKTGVNLLSSEGGPVTTPKTVAPEAPPQWVSYLKPNVTIAILDHFYTLARSSVTPQLREHFEFVSDDADEYLPLTFFDEFWLLRDDLVPVNDTLDAVTLHLEVGTANHMWAQLKWQFEQSLNMQVNVGIAADGEGDEVKRIFRDGNPVLLAVTMVVSMLHSVFDFLAFKNDVTFWKDNRSMEGLSARSILVNAFCQFVILLYLFDNETSTVVLISSAVGTAIEFWKVTRAFDVSVSSSFPYLHIKDKVTSSIHDTNKHDKEAMRYLSYALYPCVIGYSIYTLYYDTHKSWYSWVLGSLVGAVYTFGFILMCPQLYLNYKLKSVAHLPWRQMTYKFLNTIIDDLFAFVIKMPTLHRLSVFRDDLVFLIFIYQRWIYRVDKTRVNEFGFSQEMQEERERQRAAAAAAGGAAPAIGAPEGEGAGEGGSEGAAPAGGEQQQGGGARRRKQQAAGGAAAEGEGAGAAEGEGEANGESRKDQ